MQLEEKIFFNEIKNRNQKVYKTLFSDYYAPLVKFAEGYIFDRQECEDIVQNLFIYFWENAEKITLDLSIKSYFYQSVKNRCLNHLRNMNIHDRHHLLYIEALLNQYKSDEYHDAEILSKISAAVALLPTHMANIFRLRYLEGKKIAEIANIHEITENTVKTHLKRAKEKLRKSLIKNTLIKFLF